MTKITLPTNHRFENLTHRRFNRLKVVSFAGTRGTGGNSSAYWNCVCKCGNKTIVKTSKLKNNSTLSCGCLGKEKRKKANTTHGMSNTRTIHSWRGMHDRCTNKKNQSFMDYGGRGVAVCERWNSFENFLADMGECPSNKHSIDRFPNNDGNYEPGNCRWATHPEQRRNARNTILITYKGKTLCLSDWADLLGMSRTALNLRIVRRGWDIEKALTTPVRKFKSRK